MVRVRKVAEQTVRDAPLVWRLLSPFREALGGASQLDSQLNESALGALAARRLVPGAVLVMMLPALFVVVIVGLVLLATHLRAMAQLGPVVTYGLEVAVVVALVGWTVVRVRQSRKAEPEPASVEFTLAPSEVEERLASGQLRPFDLVHDGQVWNTLEQSPQFEFACEVPVAKARTRRRLIGAAKFVAWSAAIVLYARWLLAE